jgi:hypothetical protein
MKSVKIIPRRGEGGEGRMMKRVNLIRYIISTYVNITIYPLCNYYMLIIILKQMLFERLSIVTSADDTWRTSPH